MKRQPRSTLALLAVAVLLKTSSAAGGTAPDPVRLAASVDAYVEERRQAARIPGVAVGISTADGVLHLRGYGRRAGGGDPVTPDTRFMIGSVAKTVTSLAVMTLVEAGRISLDAPVVHYVPAFRVADPGASRRITIRQLMNHTSGLPGSAGFLLADEDDRTDDALPRYVRALASVRLVDAPGTVFHYSNANYIVLGEVVRRVAGTTYERYVDEHIFRPLGMTRTFAAQGWLDPSRDAEGHHYWFGFPAPAFDMPFNRAYVPVALQASTARDLLRYLQEFMGSPRGRLISASGVTLLETPSVEMKETREQYGLGWVVRDIAGLRVISHVGVLPQYRASVIIVPEGPWGVVVLMNASTVLMDRRIQELADGVASLVAGRTPTRRAESAVDRAVAVGLPAVAALQIFGCLRFFVVRSRCRRRLDRKPEARATILRHVLAPLALNTGLAAALILVPRVMIGAPFWAMLVFAPDLACLLAAMATFAVGWGVFRSSLAWTTRPTARAVTASQVE